MNVSRFAFGTFICGFVVGGFVVGSFVAYSTKPDPAPIEPAPQATAAKEQQRIAPPQAVQQVAPKDASAMFATSEEAVKAYRESAEMGFVLAVWQVKIGRIPTEDHIDDYERAKLLRWLHERKDEHDAKTRALQDEWGRMLELERAEKP